MLLPMIRTMLLAVVLVGCGRAELQGPPAVETAPEEVTAPAAPACVVINDFRTARSECDTVSALQVVSVKVQNHDGSSPWTYGAPVVRAVLRNTTGDFLNYPGLEVRASAPALRAPDWHDSLYGMRGCQEAELGVDFGGTVPRGKQVTFTAFPAFISGQACPFAYAPLSVTVTAP